MAKLKRSAHLLYVDGSFGGTTAWYLVGKDIEELEVDLGADTETVKNILGETSVKLNGYEPNIEASPYICDPTDALYEKLLAAAMERVMDDSHCKTKFLEVVIEDTSDSSHAAWQQDCYVVPQSVGGDTSGLQIPFNIIPTGTRVAGTATIAAATRIPTFTAAT